jgi:hypothetical protein
MFALVLLGFAVLWWDHRFRKDPTPQLLADQIELLLTGSYAGSEVDDFETQSIRDPELKDLHRKSLIVGGLPEEWLKLPEPQKAQLREIIHELRNLDKRRKPATSV